MTPSTEITDRDRRLARNCLRCPVCKRARKQQRGLFYWLVKRVESAFCPQCRAYAKVYGRRAHEPLMSSPDEPGAS